MEGVLDMAVTTVTSLSGAFTSGVSLSGEEAGNEKQLVEEQSMEDLEGDRNLRQNEAEMDEHRVSEPVPSNDSEKMVTS